MSRPARLGRALAWTGAGALAFAIGCASTRGGQPHMQRALDHLQAARSELESAARDKGGHRVNAVRLVNEAIDEVNRGIAAGAVPLSDDPGAGRPGRQESGPPVDPLQDLPTGRAWQTPP